MVKKLRRRRTVPPAQVTSVDSALPPVRAIYSFVVDRAPRFAYQGFHLAQSLIEHCADRPADIHVHFTAEVAPHIRDIFAGLGCQVHDIERFGDGKYCNKLAQLPNLLALDFDRAVLLDTDMIAVGDLRLFLRPEAVLAKVVDRCNPSREALRTVAQMAGVTPVPAEVSTDSGDGATYLGNSNGGFYSIPRRHAVALSQAWRKWAVWLLEHPGPLARENKCKHVDQVAMWLALQSERIPFQHCASNVNYYLHADGDHRYFDCEQAICLLHYHDSCINMLGLVVPKTKLAPSAAEAVARANAQIGRHFNKMLFSNMRYERFPDWGVGSRG